MLPFVQCPGPNCLKIIILLPQALPWTSDHASNYYFYPDNGSGPIKETMILRNLIPIN